MILILTLIVSQAAAQSTHRLALTKHFGSVRASSFLTLVFIGFSSFFSYPFTNELQAVFLGSSFIGMTDPERLSKIQIFFASILFSFIFHFLVIYMNGPGGVLGFSAFTSCLIIHFLWRMGSSQGVKFRRPKQY